MKVNLKGLFALLVSLVIFSPTQAQTLNAITKQNTAFTKKSQSINGKTVSYIVIDMNNPTVKPKISTANNKINRAASISSMAKSANSKVTINGTYFAAYNGAMPLPDGTLVRNKKPLHITDMGCTVGFTDDNEVLIDFVKTRVQGYVNDNPHWLSYRVNRPTPDPSATVLYTSEYAGNIPLQSGNIAVVCQNNEVIKKVTESRTVPSDGFILTMRPDKAATYQIGDKVTYEVTFSPKNTSEEAWKKVTYALSAGPSLLINGQATAAPANEGFTEAKILTQAAARSFIGVNAKNQVFVGTTSASINEMKQIVKKLGLTSAMCLDGGASSGLYYNGSYITSPGREINNCIHFTY